ncbi:acyl-CoA mutase large subunit family protein [Bacillus tianshenii]|nr:acyl-CoA mutase large subunit family protein [Bacillus tianshenii]
MERVCAPSADSDKMAEEKQTVDLSLFSGFPVPSDEEWKETAEKSLKGKPLEKLNTNTYEGIQLKPIYRKSDVEGIPHLKEFPGEGNYVRGASHLGYVASPWKIGQEIYAETPELFNERLLHDLQRGQTMVNVPFDEAVKQGLDASEANGADLGFNGMSFSNVEDWKTALKDVELQGVPMYLQGGYSTPFILASLLSYAKNEGVPFEELEVFGGFDYLGLVAETGKAPISFERALDLQAQAAVWADKNAKKIRTVAVQGEPYAQAGASAVQELSFAIAAGVDVIRGLLKHGLDIDQAAKQMYFSFAIGSNVFMEIGKLRAAKMVWAKIIEAFGGSEEAQKMYIHGRTSTFTKTKCDPYVNMLRTTTEAFAGAVGGVNSMHVSPFDEPLRKPDNFSRRIARNTQVILQEESHLNKVVDPAGGSWYVETLTDKIAEKTWELFTKVEQEGGMYKALQNGFVQENIAQTAQQKRQDVESRKARIVGTNMYPNLDEKPLNTTAEQETTVADRVAVVKGYVEAASGVTIGFESFEKVMDAASEGVTVGMVMNALKEGTEAVEVKPLHVHRAAEPFEALRNAAASFKAENGRYPQVFLANLGPIPKHKARADFAAGFFAAGGFEAITNNGFNTAEEAATAATQSGAEAVIICGSDDTYEELAVEVASKLKAQQADTKLYLAGNPQGELAQACKEAGIEEFVHLKSNCYDVLLRLQQEKGVIA